MYTYIHTYLYVYICRKRWRRRGQEQFPAGAQAVTRTMTRTVTQSSAFAAVLGARRVYASIPSMCMPVFEVCACLCVWICTEAYDVST